MRHSKKRDDMLVHKSTYLDVPKSWLENQFFGSRSILKSYILISIITNISVKWREQAVKFLIILKL